MTSTPQEAGIGAAVGRSIIAGALEEGRSALDEREAKALLSAYGIGTPLGRVVESAEEAARAVQALGRAAVLKGLGPDVQHKSDRGLVELDVRDAAAARAAYHRIVELGAGRLSGVLVEELVPHQRELLVGMRRDEQFGPVVAFGLGGIFTEALADVAFALAPLTDDEASELIGQLRAQRLLGRLRGLPSVPRTELLGVIQAVSQMALDHPAIREIDVNPLLDAGSALVAADALVVLDTAAAIERSAVASAGPGGAKRLDLDAVFAPRSVAVVGASEDVTKWGGSLLRNLLDGGYEGAIYPVNPRGGTIYGLPACTALDEVPGRPDLVVVALGGALAAPIVTECGRRGIPAAMVIAAGFSEAGEEGAALERELAAAAVAGGVTLVGPNCMGVLCTSSQLSAIGFVTLRPEAGPLSVVSQSGNIGTQLLMAVERRGMGVEKYVSSGNQATTDANDLLAYLADDPRSGVVIMYLESMDDGRRFYEVARGATPRKAVVVMRGGLSAFGRRAASSHTGALAGSAEVFAAAARQAGVITCADPDEALDVAACLAYLPPPRGRRVAVVTLGGGWGVLTADALAANGLELADLPPDVLAAIGELLPAYWSHGNPIDLVTSVTGGVPERIIELVAGCEQVDALVTLALLGSPSSGRAAPGIGAAGEGCNTESRGETPAGEARSAELNEREIAFLRHVATVMERTQKPVLSVPLCPVRRSVFPALGPYAPVLLPSPPAAVRALARAAWYADYRARRSGAPSSPEGLGRPAAED